MQKNSLGESSRPKTRTASLELSLRVINDEVTRRSLLEQTHLDAVQRCRYDVDLAQRRYEQVDVVNRLIAATLERNWEAALQQLNHADTALAEFRQFR